VRALPLPDLLSEEGASENSAEEDGADEREGARLWPCVAEVSQEVQQREPAAADVSLAYGGSERTIFMLDGRGKEMVGNC
jgi:hypothetical protein